MPGTTKSNTVESLASSPILAFCHTLNELLFHWKTIIPQQHN